MTQKTSPGGNPGLMIYHGNGWTGKNSDQTVKNKILRAFHPSTGEPYLMTDPGTGSKVQVKDLQSVANLMGWTLEELVPVVKELRRDGKLLRYYWPGTGSRFYTTSTILSVWGLYRRTSSYLNTKEGLE